MKTTITPDKALAIPFVNAAHKELNEKTGRFVKKEKVGEPEILRNSLVQKMFKPEELESLIIVKTDSKNPDPKDLRTRKFEDKIERELIFSSGSSNYFGDKELAEKIGKLFDTEPDTACRYGSLLVSNCMEGNAEVENIRVKIVDYEDPQFAEFKTGDCHGKISPALAEQMGGSDDRATQFRFSWLKDWDNEDSKSKTPEVDFLAKGTLLPDPALTDDKDYDLILDRSSIKGINKAELKDVIPCGDYEFPKAIMGNRENSSVGKAKNSWQLFGIWASEEAQRADLVPETKRQAEELAGLQQDPLKLAKYLVEKYDEREKFSQNNEEEGALNPEDVDEDSDEKKKKQEMGMIKILREDKYGQMLENPAVVDFMQKSVAKEWKELAINSGIKLSSEMVLPCPDIPEGTICAKHLPDEEDIVMTRYPILNKDNIRLYTNDTESFPDLTKYEGIIWVNPKDFEKYHQGDFDGDKAVTIPAKDIPNIAKEFLRAGEDPEYISVIKAKKVPYTDVVDEKGEFVYDTLGKISVASSQQSVGLVATNIGRVASAEPNEGEDLEEFEAEKKKLIIGLSIMEQYEVDYQKNSLRGKDAKEILQETGIKASELLAVTKEFCENHPCKFFDYKKDEHLYIQFPMPTEGDSAINVLAREAVNPAWEASQLKERPRQDYVYLLPKETDPEKIDVDKIEEDANWAKGLNQRFKDDVGAIKARTKDDKVAFKEAIGNLYEGYRTEVNELCGDDPERRKELATALMHVTHTNPNESKHRTKCQEVAEDLTINFNKIPEYQLLHEAVPREAYVLQVPFQKVDTEQQELVVAKTDKIEKALKDRNISFDTKGGKYDKKLIVSNPNEVEKVQKLLDNNNIKYKMQPVQGHLPNQIKGELDAKGIKYEAIAHETLPLVEFALKVPTSGKLPKETAAFINKLAREHEDNKENIIDSKDERLKLDYDGRSGKLMVVPPVECKWIEPREKPGRSKLLYSLFADELAKVLADFKVEEIGIVGVKQENNGFKDENFADKKWEKPVTLTVGKMDLPKDNKFYATHQGNPVIKLEGKQLGTPDGDSPRLPVGTTFEAVIKPGQSVKTVKLIVNEASIKLPEVTSKKGRKEEQKANARTEEKPQSAVSKPTINKQTSDATPTPIIRKPTAEATEPTSTSETKQKRRGMSPLQLLEEKRQKAKTNAQVNPTAEATEPTNEKESQSQKTKDLEQTVMEKISTQMKTPDRSGEERDLTKTQRFNLCNWKASVSPSKVCMVRDEDQKLMLACKLNTKEIIRELSNANAEILDRDIKEKQAAQAPRVAQATEIQA